MLKIYSTSALSEILEKEIKVKRKTPATNIVPDTRINSPVFSFFFEGSLLAIWDALTFEAKACYLNVDSMQT